MPAMKPQIRYAKTDDGVSIAYWSIGQGPAVVVMRLPMSHAELEWQDAEDTETWTATSRVATLIRYDPRGFGLSDRNIDDFSIDRMVADLEAVAGRLELRRFALVSNGATSPVALAYAARHPAQVARLVLQPGFDRIAGTSWDQWELLASDAAADWEFASEAMIRSVMGWNDDSRAKADAAFLRAAVSPEDLKRYLRDIRKWDVRDLVPHVRAPTLLTQLPNATYTTIENARSLVAALPDGRLSLIEGLGPTRGGGQQVAETARFLGGDPELFADNTTPAGTAIILFTDIADSTALTERMGDTAFRDASRALDASIRAAIRAAGGSPVEGKVLGDGVMGTFASAAQAIAGARTCITAADDARFLLHIGLHAGDVLRERDNVYGGAVNVASRICGLCEPGEILVSGTVRDLARTSAGVTFEDRGEHALKGIADPVRVFAVRSQE
jgi:class 3 adenylate cyclase/pimeloyl-ACP methyl ester carboxylesterase